DRTAVLGDDHLRAVGDLCEVAAEVILQLADPNLYPHRCSHIHGDRDEMASWSVRFGGVRGVVGCGERAGLDATLGVLHDLVGDLIWRWLGLVVAHRGMVAPTNSRRNGGPVA